MSSNDPSEKRNSSASASRSESPVVAPFKHQHSFEERYSAIINQQILENTINKEALQRQVQAFFPISRSTSRDSTKKKENGNEGSNSDSDNLDEHSKVLQKLETLDMKDKEET